MYKVLKFGAYFGIAASLAGCGTSEHFMQDDVYNTRTPIMPPGTDLNDVTDYATFVAKKEQTEAPAERTAYVSPRQYNDYFYNSQFLFYGYSPYSTLTGIGYYGYGGYYHPYGYGYGNALYPSIGFGSYYSSGYNPYGFYGNPYYGFGQSNPYNGNSWYTTSSKPGTGSNLSHASAKVAGGRGSNTAPAGYPHQISANSGSNPRFDRIDRSSTVRIGNVAPTGSGRVPVTGVSGRATQPTRPVSAGNPSTGTQRTGSYQQRPTINSNSTVTRPTIKNSDNNSTPTRTSSPTIRSGGSGSGTPSSGGSRSGGRR